MNRTTPCSLPLYEIGVSGLGDISRSESLNDHSGALHVVSVEMPKHWKHPPGCISCLTWTRTDKDDVIPFSGGSRISGKGGAGWRVAEGHERCGAWGGGVPLPTGVGSGEGLCPSPEKF